MSLHRHSVADETTRRALCSIQGRIAVRARVTLRSVPARDETAADGAWARGGGGRAPSGSGAPLSSLAAAGMADAGDDALNAREEDRIKFINRRRWSIVLFQNIYTPLVFQFQFSEI